MDISNTPTSSSCPGWWSRSGLTIRLTQLQFMGLVASLGFFLFPSLWRCKLSKLPAFIFSWVIPFMVFQSAYNVNFHNFIRVDSMRVTQIKQWRLFKSMLREQGKISWCDAKTVHRVIAAYNFVVGVVFFGALRLAGRLRKDKVNTSALQSMVFQWIGFSSSGDWADGERLGEPWRGKLSWGCLASAWGFPPISLSLLLSLSHQYGCHCCYRCPTNLVVVVVIVVIIVPPILLFLLNNGEESYPEAAWLQLEVSKPSQFFFFCTFLLCEELRTLSSVTLYCYVSMIEIFWGFQLTEMSTYSQMSQVSWIALWMHSENVMVRSWSGQKWK